MSNHHLFIDQYQWFLDVARVPTEMPAGGPQLNAAYMATIDRVVAQFNRDCGAAPDAPIGWRGVLFQAYLRARIAEHVDHAVTDALIAAWKEQQA